MKETDKNTTEANVDKNLQVLTAKLEELQAVYNENEMTILGLYRNLENARKQVDDNERQILKANNHQQGLQREIEDLGNMISQPKKEAASTV